MNLGWFKKVTNPIYLIYTYKDDLALNNLQYDGKPNQTNHNDEEYFIGNYFESY